MADGIVERGRRRYEEILGEERGESFGMAREERDDGNDDGNDKNERD